MLLSYKKISAMAVMIGLLIVQLVFVIPNMSPNNVTNPDETLVQISILCTVSLLIEVFLWVRFTGEFFSPYMIFFLVLFIFTCGQGLGWAIGLDMGHKDMWNRIDHGTNRALLTSGLCYSMMAIGCFHLGAIACYSDIKNNIRRIWSSEYVVSVYKNLGKFLLPLVIPAFIAKTTQDVLAVASGGYNAFYDVNQSRSVIMDMFSILAGYYQPCMLILLIGNRNDPMKRRLIVLGMLIDVAFLFFVGGRSSAVMVILGILIAYHYFVKPFNAKQVVSGAVIGYVGVAFLNTIALIRGGSERNFSDVISVFFASFSNAIGDFIGELGWTITSVCWTMNLVPRSEPFRHGMSYLVSVLTWIPSSVFGGKEHHPVVIWGNLGDWLCNTLNMLYGPGYTTTAESYINFGWFGLLAMIVEGVILCRILASVKRKHVEEDMLGATFQTLVIMIVMKSIVRSSLTVAMRYAFFVLIPLYLLLYFSLKKGAEQKK